MNINPIYLVYPFELFTQFYEEGISLSDFIAELLYFSGGFGLLHTKLSQII
nr:MAG TPA: hypothetical protein [Caudoviricetes sp.]